MSKKKVVDLLFLVLIGYFISVGIFNHFVYGHTLSLNFYFGLIAWVSVSYFILFTIKGNFLIFYLLVFGVFNVFVFSSWLSSFGAVYYIYQSDDFIISYLGINPFVLLLILIYFFINRSTIMSHIRRLTEGTEEEISLRFKNKVKFYYDKFNLYTSDELKDVYKIYDEYPEEAKMALREIHEERNLKYRSL
jgi:hypothetical protein